jgi:hypothetical protein
MAILSGFFVAILLGAVVLMWLPAFISLPSGFTPFLSDLHPLARLTLSLMLFGVGILLAMYTIELCLTIARTRLLIAPEGFIYTSNGGHLWSSWDNAVRIEHAFIYNRWHEWIELHTPANIVGRSQGFTVFSTGIFPWQRFIPLTIFGDLWRTWHAASRNEIQQLMKLAQKLLPAHAIRNRTASEGPLCRDIRRWAPHIFARE